MKQQTNDPKRDELRRRIRDLVIASDAYESDAQVERARRADALAFTLAEIFAPAR